MKQTAIAYTIISILTLIYLTIFSSHFLWFTNLQPVTFNIVSSIMVFGFLDVCYKLYFKKYQLKIYETISIFLIYITLMGYLLFFKNIVPINAITMDFIPLFFEAPSTEQLILMVGNIALFTPIGFFFSRVGFKLSLLFILILSFVIEASQYIFHVGVFDLSDILLYFVGFYIGLFYQKITKSLSERYNNASYDLRLLFTLMMSIAIITFVINTIYF